MNRHLKKTVRYTVKLLAGIVGFIIVYALAVLVVSRIPVNREPEKGEDVTIYIHSNGVHTDIVVPVKNEVKDWSREVLFCQTKAKGSLMQYVAFGWGDKGFYLNTPQWSDLKMSVAARAAFHLGTSAMHTRFYKTVQEDARCIKITISKKEYENLVAYISGSFQPDGNNRLKWIENRGYGNDDAFYEAKGKYSLFYTCNTWTNNALKAAHQRACLWTVYDGEIFYQYK